MHNGKKLFSAIALAAGLFAASSASASLTVQYTFCPHASCPSPTPDGETPFGAPVFHGSRLYGATSAGGANGVGAVYRYNPSTSNYTRIFDFTTSGPNTPKGAMIVDSNGDLYGTASAGGAHSGGAVYKLSNATGTWTLTTIYDFCTTTSGSICTDGKEPRAGLTYAGQAGGSDYDGSALLFGSTFFGGNSDAGTVFALQLSGGVWSEKVIHHFAGATADGASPTASMWMDAVSGKLYGTTQNGGSASKGAVFILTPGMNQWTNAWTETIAYNMCWTNVTKCPDGNKPTGIVVDGSGNILGAAELGGNGINPQGGGTLYKLNNPGGCTEGGAATFWCLTVLHNFCPATNCTDAYTPALTTNPALDGSGDLWGVSSFGGTGGGGFPGSGTVYKYTSGGVYSVVQSFCTAGCANGEGPISTPVFDGSGNVYGVTSNGGDGTTDAGIIWSIP